MKTVTFTFGNACVVNIVYDDNDMLETACRGLQNGLISPSYTVEIPIPGGVFKIKAGALLSYSVSDPEECFEHDVAWDRYNRRREKRFEELREEDKLSERAGFKAPPLPTNQ